MIKISAARIVASTFGILAGLGGITHGVGETLQGNVTPDGIFINSWTQGPIATNMGGEPGMTVVPNLLLTGILTIIVSLAVIVWSTALVRRGHGGLVLILLSIAMLLVGGGFGPPIIGVLAGVAGLGIQAPHTWWREHLPVRVRRFLAGSWPWVFGVCVINGVFLVVGSVILVYLFGLNNPNLFVGSFFFAVVSLLVTVFSGIAYDIQQGERGAVVPS
ncbi:MAG TPA: hypothetical protein VHM16_06670 [Rubrobacteraceae bacterium]|nr:hypothetical protein [Rubrobacteraceae bacterium]